MNQPVSSRKSPQQDYEPKPSEWVDFEAAGVRELEGLSIADLLKALPELARELNAYRKKHNLPGPGLISDHAIIGQDVYIGPGARVYEFSTVRDGAIICSNAVVGFGNEMVNTFVGKRSHVFHRNSIGSSVIGNDAYITAGVTAAATLFANPDMSRPTVDILIPMSDGTVYNTDTPKFGAVIGDGTRVGMHAALGPGVIIGRASQIGAMVRLTPGIYPDGMHIRDAGFRVIDAASIQTNNPNQSL
jgi:NDP-sugar pyrophosphorylase family protein